MVMAEDSDLVFHRDATDRPLLSPFMSFAPVVKPDAAAALPAITHYDSTARPQTVTKEEDPWVHALLGAVKEQTGWAVLINTSFNTKVDPFVFPVVLLLS
jgi:carbamoyltransferase